MLPNLDRSSSRTEFKGHLVSFPETLNPPSPPKSASLHILVAPVGSIPG